MTEPLVATQAATQHAAVDYWSSQLNIPREQLRLRLKAHNPTSKRKNAGVCYYGTMKMVARRSTLLNHRIAGWIRGLAKHCGVV